jgi:cobalt-zinc-cadmium efflux system outer membrane protein
VAGFSVPLPLFTRNAGGIVEAQTRLQKSEQLRSAVELQVRTVLTKSYQKYSTSKLEVEALRSRVLPASQTTFDAISEGYRLGKYGYLDVLEAQRSLVQSRLQLLRAMSDIYESVAEMERITGTAILKLDGGAR